MVIYVDKKGQRLTYPLSSVLEVPSPELAKRLRYTKDILVNLLGCHSSSSSSSSSTGNNGPRTGTTSSTVRGSEP